MQEQNDNVLTVTQLTNLIKTMLEGAFPIISLKGEISNFRPNASGHLYFVLKDNESQISAVMFKGKAASLNFKPKDGMLVQARGSISVYGPRGNYQIILSSMTVSGIGDIMEMIEERKNRLAKEGLFDGKRKKELPFFPKTVGIITSPTGAALRDILQITKRRNPKQSVVILPALVQGEGAALSIIQMIKAANEWSLCDVLIVGRGGGSLEDLLPFSDEGVVRAIAASDIPIVSAVGHEIDWALSDYAADMRAPTPSAAAELAVPQISEILASVEGGKADLISTMQNIVNHYRLILKTFTRENMELQFRRIESPILLKFEDAKQNLIDYMQNKIDEKMEYIRQSIATLENCSPQSILNRGYSMVKEKNTGKIIRSASDIKSGTSILIQPAEGIFSATVE